MIKKLLLGLASAALISGCSTLPKFEVSPAGVEEHIGPTVEQLLSHIQCEIWTLMTDKSAVFDTLRRQHYLATGTLTLDVVDVQNFSPSIGVVEPLLRAGTNRTIVLGGQLQGTQHRTMNLTFSMDLDPTHKIDPSKTDKCAKGTDKDGLKGDLGLRELVLSGLQAREGVFYLDPHAYDKDGKEIPLAFAAPSFGTTVDFQILRSIGGGPTWTLTYFKGPAGGSNLINFQKTRKDTLVLGFASAGPRVKVIVSGKNLESQSLRPDTPAVPSNVEQALRNAQDNVTRMILQRLLPQ